MRGMYFIAFLCIILCWLGCRIETVLDYSCNGTKLEKSIEFINGKSNNFGGDKQSMGSARNLYHIPEKDFSKERKCSEGSQKQRIDRGLRWIESIQHKHIHGKFDEFRRSKNDEEKTRTVCRGVERDAHDKRKDREENTTATAGCRAPLLGKFYQI